MKRCYVYKTFHVKTMDIIDDANKIIKEYAAQGYDLTLRQLYYQFVARALLPNTAKSYNKLGIVVNDARLAGYIDWAAIKDRTRALKVLPHWKSPGHVIRSTVKYYQINKWATQDYVVECWIEKDALIGVILEVCEDLDIACFACRGYISQSFMYEAGVRLARYIAEGKTPLILHLGDHDPSGIDMTRDIEDRLRMFTTVGVEVRRLALNMDQVEEYNPPPNPAKLTDTRANDYIDRFGDESWELDALEPKTIVGLIQKEVLSVRDEDLWDEAVAQEDEDRERLQELAEEA